MELQRKEPRLSIGKCVISRALELETLSFILVLILHRWVSLVKPCFTT